MSYSLAKPYTEAESNLLRLVDERLVKTENPRSAVSEAQQTTASTSFVTALTTTVALPAGNYVLNFTALVGNATASALHSVQVLADSVSTGVATYTGAGTGLHQTYSGFQYLTLTAGSHTFAIQHKATTGTSEIKNARLLLTPLN